MKHPLPSVFEKEMQRTGQYRTLREELIYDFQSSLYQGSQQAVVRLLFTVHPRDENYGGTVVFVRNTEDESLPLIAAPLAQGIWQALAEFRLMNFALLVQEVEAALSDEADALLVELGGRAVRHALHDAELVTHEVPGWVKTEQDVTTEPVEEEDAENPRLSGAETRAKRELRRELQRTLDSEQLRSAQKGSGRRNGERKHRRGEERRTGDRPGRGRGNSG